MDPSIFLENSVSQYEYLSQSNYSIVGTNKDLDKLLSMPIEDQCVFADKTCKDHCEELLFLESNLPENYLDGLAKKILDKSWMYFRTETIGNLAYLSLYSVEPYTNRARNTLLVLTDTYKLHKNSASKWNTCNLF